jgi:hypothetical protein
MLPMVRLGLAEFEHGLIVSHHGFKDLSSDCHNILCDALRFEVSTVRNAVPFSVYFSPIPL